MQILMLLALFFWELPQNIVGLLVFSIMKMKKRIVCIEKEKYRYFIETPKIGVSLGWFVFWSPVGNRFAHLTNDCRMHEYGHARQSVMLGPLYLIIIGIPSLSRVFYGRWYRRKYGHNWKNYFNAFPESWADKLGGIVTDREKS
jgi:hypothetical protein